MDFDGAKENIQPLAAGRNASILHASLQSDSAQELLTQRQELERAIHLYQGDDPLEVWYDYIAWIEQSFPCGGKESGLEEVLTKCLSCFENDSRYFQDRRMIKLYIKFIEMHKDQNAAGFYQQLFSSGIGTMVADFYISWAYCYDLSGNYRKADEIFKRGIDCRAEPINELQEARKHFGFIIAQRSLHENDENATKSANNQLEERRLALSSLRSHRKKVGSIRTGAAVKSYVPGTLKTSTDATTITRHKNAKVQVFTDENAISNALSPTLPPSTVGDGESTEIKSVVRSIVDAARNQENKKEPGPWNKAHDKKKGKLFGKTNTPANLAFDILEDETIAKSTEKEEGNEETNKENIVIDKPFKPFPNFKHKNRPLPEWITPVTIENAAQPGTYPQYNKCKLYPRPNREYQLEEYLAYTWFCKRGISNKFTRERDIVWKSHEIGPVRQYPNFAKKSRPRALDSMDEYFEPEAKENLAVNFNELYNSAEKIEMQIEEVLAARWKAGKRKLKHNPNDTIMIATEMDETVCVPEGEQINRRKSFFPSRKSLAAVSHDARPSILSKAPLYSPLNIPSPLVEEGVEDEGIPNENLSRDPHHSQESSLQKEPENSSPIVATSSDNAEHELQKSLEGFKIYEDTEQPTTSAAARAKALNAIYQEKLQEKTGADKASVALSIYQDSFEFKPPIAPDTGGKVKTSFEIYEECKEEQPSANPNRENCAFFEADDTCSTQAFNFFIKYQSVSTPNAPQKTRPRVFGTILKDKIDPEPYEEISPVAVVTSDELPDAKVCTEGAIAYSPPCPKQLSTILEISEQGTHTKSTASSPKTDSLEAKESRLLASQTHLDTVKEQTFDAQTQTHRLSQDDTEIVGREKLQVTQGQPHESTPATTRIQNAGIRNFSIFEDPTESDVLPERVGHFSRLEERENTTACLNIQPIKFQEDKTETITKILSASKPIDKFDEVTDTVSKQMFIPAAPAQFEEDKTGTLDKMPFLPPSSVNKLSSSLEDSFTFFTQTPPKSGNVFASQRSMSTTSEFCNFEIKDSPESRAPKLRCNYSSPELRGKFLVSNKSNEANNKSSALKASLSMKKSIHEDCSTAYPTQSTNREKSSAAEDLRKLMDSFMPEFSFIEETQPQTAPRCTEPSPQISDSFVKDSQPHFIGGSRLKIQPVHDAKPKSSMLDSFNLPDFSMVMDSQPSHVKASKCANMQVDNHEHILTDSYMKDFSAIKQPSPRLSARNISKAELKCLPDKLTSSRCDTRNSIQFQAGNNANATFTDDDLMKAPQSLQKYNQTMELQFDNDANKMLPPPPHLGKSFKTDDCFEFNAETAQFAPNLSIIKNSTLLLNEDKQRHTLFQEKSLHIKEELVEPEENMYQVFKAPAALQKSHSSEVAQQSFTGRSVAHDSRCSTALSHTLQNAKQPNSAENLRDTKSTTTANLLKTPVNPTAGTLSYADDYDNEMSIYVKHTPKTPKIQRHIWNDSNEEQQTNSAFVHLDADINETQLAIEQICLEENVNPFNLHLISAFLEEIHFTNYINELSTCELIGKVTQLHKDSIVKVNDIQFKVQKLIGEGGFGAVYCATETKTGKKYALKQERPPNFWEYYICLEVHDRLKVDELIPAFMSVDYALIGRNSSILISPFSTYGSLITVCNKIKKVTMKNVDEYVVMHITCLLLEMMDHLHALEIIHADIKADNFLLMQKLSRESNQSPIQLIDFGVSIDMRRFKKGQTFSYSHKDLSMKCVEMRENRPWTYQLDLYGLAGVIHVLLFGKYMDVHKIALGFWMHKTHVPRYLNRTLWDTIFRTLLNIQDCSSMPNLQNLRVLLKEEIAEKENYFIQKLFEFNRALNC